MQSDIVTNYLELRQKLVDERARLENRLQEITQVLEQAGTPVRLPGRAPKRGRRPVKLQTATPSAKPKRRLSPEGRRHIIEATKERWAKLHAQKAATPLKAAKPAKAVRRRMSKAARAKMAASAKARWAKAKAAGRNKL